MELTDEQAQDYGTFLQMRQLWARYPKAALTVEPTSGAAYSAHVDTGEGGTADAHSQDALRALGRVITFIGITNDLAR